MLLRSEHEYRKDQLCCEEHFNEEAADDRGFRTKSRADIERAWEEAGDDACSGNGTDYLSDDDQKASDPTHSSDQAQAEGDLVEQSAATLMAWKGSSYGRIEQSAGDAEEDPDVDS